MKNKKLILPVLGLVGLAAFTVSFFIGSTRPARDEVREASAAGAAPRAAGASAAAASRTAASSVPASAVAAASEAEAKETVEAEPQDGGQVLKGRDFIATVSLGEQEESSWLSVAMADGTVVREAVLAGGETVPLESLAFGGGDRFELKSIIPGTEREQLVVTGSEWIPRGYGSLGTYSIFSVGPKQLVEVLDLITERDFVYVEGEPAQHLEATVALKTRDGRPRVEYRYAADGAAARTIVFEWNGEAFVDPTGEYRRIEQRYRP